jgi:Ras-related protein Rab-5C
MTESFKVVLVGAASVGKTSIIQRYTKDEFDKYSETTVGAHFVTRIIDLSDIPGNSGTGKIKL